LKKRQSAQYIVDNSGSSDAAVEQMTQVLEEIILKRRSTHHNSLDSSNH
jgi:hypothetical protein